jgi:glycosyltransferase involved in cell wall biosynthesis
MHTVSSEQLSLLGGRERVPMFSVVMPTYNRSHVIWKAISSVLVQTHASWELIVVDDESTDATLRVLEEFADARIRTASVPHGGPSRARNEGLALARGEYVAYLDSDNTWAPDFLERFATVIAGSEDAMWYCGRTVEVWERRADRTWLLVDSREQPARPFDSGDVWALHAPDVNCLVHRREAGLAIDGWDPDCTWIEDWDFFLRLWLEHDGRCSHLPDMLVHYRQVHGEGADGICAEFREDVGRELEARRYLIDKWKGHDRFDARTLERTADELAPVRARRRSQSAKRRQAPPAWTAAAAVSPLTGTES